LASCGGIRTSRENKDLMKRASPATLDRIPASTRRENRPRGRTITHPGTLLRQQIPVRTFAGWDDAEPGFLEVDLVAHCGESAEGFFLCTLTAVDIASAWVELEAVWGKGQQRVMAAIHLVRQRLPMQLQGLDSDNGSEMRSEKLDRTIASLGAKHVFTHAGRSQTNGCVERVQRTILEECWKPAFARYLVPKITGLRRDLKQFLRYYNQDRAHTGRWNRGRTPDQVLGKAKIWSF
jgi:hypothetical protein